MRREGGGEAGSPVAPGAERRDEQEKADGGAQGPGIARRQIGVGQPDLEVAHPLTRLLLVEPPKLGGGRIGSAGHGVAQGGQRPVSQAAVTLQPAERRRAVGKADAAYAVPEGGGERCGEQEKHQRVQPAAKRRQHVEQGHAR